MVFAPRIDPTTPPSPMLSPTSSCNSPEAPKLIAPTTAMRMIAASEVAWAR
jgi:hypothetical protein